MFKMQIETGNAAFERWAAMEVARIMGRVTDQLRRGEVSGPCMDTNGNKCGTWELVVDQDN